MKKTTNSSNTIVAANNIEPYNEENSLLGNLSSTNIAELPFYDANASKSSISGGPKIISSTGAAMDYQLQVREILRHAFALIYIYIYIPPLVC